MIQISGIEEEMEYEIRQMYLDAGRRIGNTSCNDFDAIMRRIHIVEIRLINMRRKEQ